MLFHAAFPELAYLGGKFANPRVIVKAGRVAAVTVCAVVVSAERDEVSQPVLDGQRFGARDEPVGSHVVSFDIFLREADLAERVTLLVLFRGLPPRAGSAALENESVETVKQHHNH